MINRFTCERVVPGPAQNRIQHISNYGARSWVTLLPGANQLVLSSQGSGEAVLTFRPPYV